MTFFPPRKSFLLLDKVAKCCRAGQAADENMTHAHWILYTSAYKHTLRICNTHCFSSAGCTKAPQYYVIRTMPFLLIISIFIYLRRLFLHYSTTPCNSSKCKFYVTSLPPSHCGFQVAVTAVSNLYSGLQTDVFGITLRVSAVSNLCALEITVACTPINTWRPRIAG